MSKNKKKKHISKSLADSEYGGHPSLRSVPLRSFLPRQKKSTDGIPDGLPFYCVDTVKPSVAKASSFAQGYGG